MKAEKRTVFECPQCGEYHIEEQDAMDCCPVETLEKWVCSDCEEIYYTQEEAEECCNEDED